MSISRLALLFCPDEEVHDLAESRLRAAGFQVASADTGVDAAAHILKRPIELLVLDAMPIRFADLPSLRRLKEARQLRVILIPRLGETVEPGLAHVFGVDATLGRPLRRARFLSALNPPS